MGPEVATVNHAYEIPTRGSLYHPVGSQGCFCCSTGYGMHEKVWNLLVNTSYI